MSVAAGVAALAVIVALAFFADLGRPAFWDPGESRYAETTREMTESGNWMTPTLAFARYYDKPAPFFWMLAGSFAAFGRTEWAARLPSAIAAVVTIVLVFAFGWSYAGLRAAVGAGVVLATAAQFVALGRSVRMDMLLTLLTTAALMHGFVLLGGRPRRSSPWSAAVTWPLYVAIVLGIFVKGPIGLVLPVLVLGAYAAATRPLLSLSRLRPGVVSIAAVIGLAAWYAAQAVYAPDYLWTFLWQHNLGRFVGRTLAGHSNPIWFYVWTLPLTFLPWTMFLPAAMRRTIRRARRGDRLERFLLAWCALPFAFFSLSRAKLATYLLPIFPALALIVAIYLDRVLRAPAPTRARALAIPALLWSATLTIIAVATPLAAAIMLPGYAGRALAVLPLAAYGVASWLIRRRGAWRTVPALVAMGMLTLQIVFFHAAAPVVDDFASLRAAARAAAALPADTLVFAYKIRGHSFTYYGGRSLMRARSPAEVAAALGRSGPTAALVKHRHIAKIRQHLRQPACIWWQSPAGRVLITNRPTPDGSGVPLLPPSAHAGDGVPHC
ncbi:MAG: hypothetical protein B6D46_13355 [Polyangiaceae bacterium UTPRO1]|jgi:4-amino-4-deoxy-L-arabinose transferase-like glycosyltransferase|nr:glycosyltransferase family 39 protein [Myxococcales bacterium]OQY65685.1 MAG: hypothetical protein B6D46_13355 [Polyangiaceae bacterium UTPRO1]